MYTSDPTVGFLGQAIFMMKEGRQRSNDKDRGFHNIVLGVGSTPAEL